MKKIYVIGSLRDPKVPEIAAAIREDGHDVFDDWFAAGEVADDRWMVYEQTHRKRTLADALMGRAAKHVFEFDKHWLDWADTAVLILPAGKSAHLELGYMIGKGKKGYVLLDGEPERYDVMYQFADGVYTELDELRKVLNESGQAGQQTELERLLLEDSRSSVRPFKLPTRLYRSGDSLVRPQNPSNWVQRESTRDAPLCGCWMCNRERSLSTLTSC